MSSLNHDTFDESSHSFEDDVTGGGYAPPPQYTDFSDPHSVNNDDVFGGSNQEDPIFGEAANGPVFVESSNGPILPPPSEMQEEGSALREWRRQNAMILEQKEKREKEILSQIIEEANEYKTAFHEKRKVTCQNNKTNNREKEKSFLANHEKFHKEADKSYWKAIAELIPNEVPAIEKKREKKDQEKKPSVVVVQGPKPGKPADLARMRQILLKLKHNTPTHLKLAPPQAVTATKDGKTVDVAADTPKPAAVASTQEAVAVA